MVTLQALPYRAVPLLPTPTPNPGHLAQSCTQARGSGLGEVNRLMRLLSKHLSYPNTNAFATPVHQGRVSHWCRPWRQSWADIRQLTLGGKKHLIIWGQNGPAFPSLTFCPETRPIDSVCSGQWWLGLIKQLHVWESSLAALITYASSLPGLVHTPQVIHLVTNSRWSCWSVFSTTSSRSQCMTTFVCQAQCLAQSEYLCTFLKQIYQCNNKN